MRAAAKLSIPCYAMIRPKCGLFFFTDEEVDIMLDDIARARDAGLAGVVLGVQKEDGTLCENKLTRLVDATGDLGTTLHRVIDVVPNPLAALDVVKDLGIDRVLTSGAEPFAPEGAPLIKQMVERVKGEISIMPGCGLTPENVKEVIEKTGVHEVHAACTVLADGDPAFSDFDPPGGRYVTSVEEVTRIQRACSS